MNPLDWKGPEFLMLYVPLLVGGFLAALGGRYLLRMPAGEPLPPHLDLEPYAVALLRGAREYLEAVVASLSQRQVLRIEAGTLAPGEELPPDASPFERKVRAAVAAGNTSLSGLEQALKRDSSQLKERLIHKGLLLGPVQSFNARFIPLLAFGAILLLGAAKIAVGLSRGKPVGFLVFLLIAGSVAALFLLARKPWRSRLGDAALKALQFEHAPLRMALSSANTAPSLTGAELALGVALFGSTALAATAFPDLRDYLVPAGSSGGGGGAFDSGGGDGGSCGGGGGGCGGCGGGD